MRVAVIQMNSGPDKAANLKAAKALIERAIERDRPDLVSLPETFTIMGGGNAGRRAAAEAIPGGAAWTMLRDLAREHRVNVHGGSFFEDLGEGRLANTTVVIDRTGEEVARYRKIHLFDVETPSGEVYRESDYTVPGDRVVTVDLDGVRVGLTICYDLRFAELFLALRRAGAELILVPSAFTLPTGKDHWEVLLRARAIETQCYVAAAAQVGSFPAGSGLRHSYGHALVADPWGHVVARVSDRPGHATAELDPAYLQLVRQRLPVERHRRLGQPG
ncbi:MAG: carbon-nitrogen hydrolase family protein [Geminicoccaceae bacterium]|jgi:nitrilase|nr:carbon-nitrogen hydrolase family protein [Geminicoccaceae bacterium]MCB9968594.1 carbon-nitrogen hydrolase family protein [Geminicoccaceae bacterium]HRY23540.1 carbon-nitrogen hydrolase family protein [Geminicoccaceae bacterium]